MILSGRLAEAERLVGDAERALEDASNESGEQLDASVSLLANVSATIGLLRAGIARRRGDSEQMDVLTRQARAHLSADNEALRPMADLYLAVADARTRARSRRHYRASKPARKHSTPSCTFG
jgi:ATP/maltotriose-dependent transcriptional regulator MalT